MARTPRLIAALAALVLLGHGAALQWLASQWTEPPVLKPLVAPMFTRQVAQAAPETRKPAPAPEPVAPSRPRQPKAPELIAAAPVEATPTQVIEPQPAAPLAVASQPSATDTTAPVMAAATVTATTSSGTATVTTSHLESWPADTRLSYRLTGHYRGPLTGDARVQWQREGERYQVRVEIDIGFLASVSMTSQGDVQPAGLYPRAYMEQLPRDRVRQATLGDVNIALMGGKTHARPAGVQDTASQFVELVHQFSSGRVELKKGGTVSLWLARPNQVDLWTYDVVDEVTLYTPRLGPVQAFHLKPRPLANPRGNITAEMWFAPTLQYLPVRIKVNMGDDVNVDLMVDRIEQR
ncbi:MAG: DUF3108 domain-containing protein [Burkholderiaceae bacterium]